ncbi:10317_t:CDS:1, partial [Dentiscutata erythropus]
MTPEKFFAIFPCDFWSLEKFIAFSFGIDKSAEIQAINQNFYNCLQNINDDTNASQEARDHARKLLDEKK